jgi:hypothetical protein
MISMEWKAFLFLFAIIVLVAVSGCVTVEPGVSDLGGAVDCVPKGYQLATSQAELETTSKACCRGLQVVDASYVPKNVSMYNNRTGQNETIEICPPRILERDDPASFICMDVTDNVCESPENQCNNPDDC